MPIGAMLEICYLDKEPLNRNTNIFHGITKLQCQDMRKRPALILVMVAIQVIMVAVDLLMPFLLGTYVNMGTTDFLMAYFYAMLDFLLILGFLRGDKWAFIFGLLFSGINLTMNVFSYFSNPVLLYAIIIILRAIVMLCLRDSNVRIYMDMKKVGPKNPKKADTKKLKR